MGGHRGPRGGDGVGTLLHLERINVPLQTEAVPPQPKKVSSPLEPKPNLSFQVKRTSPTHKQVSFFTSEFIRHKIRCKPQVSISEKELVRPAGRCAIQHQQGHACGSKKMRQGIMRVLYWSISTWKIPESRFDFMVQFHDQLVHYI
ncbi:hypothetical protein TNCV_111001 [Trichonephila clavipes]|nr:hypothetical protein TNCV_111001 [Trichonephila clavipes]